MKALILNSGSGLRMGDITEDTPKCMTELVTGETLLSRQIRQLENAGVTQICITTGPFVDKLEDHARGCARSAELTFVNNPDYATTNIIYSVFLAKHHCDDDLVLLHGDLVFDDDVLTDLLLNPHSAAIVSSTMPLPKKDFKAVIVGGLISLVGVEFFDNAVAMQPLYKLTQACWRTWGDGIEAFIAAGNRTCYAEAALNSVSSHCAIFPFDVKDRLCAEVDTPDDLAAIDAVLGGSPR